MMAGSVNPGFGHRCTHTRAPGRGNWNRNAASSPKIPVGFRAEPLCTACRDASGDRSDRRSRSFQRSRSHRMSDNLKSLLARAVSGPLTREDAERAFEIIMSGEATPAQIGGFLMTLRVRGESVDEIAGAASVMRAKAVPVKAPEGAMDIVGTGGDGKGTLNISTAAAFVVAGCGVSIAKHGNRALSSRSGAADALSEMGVNVMVEAEIAERALANCGICFMMAPMHHSAMRHVGPARVELGTRTIFNLLGPLTNPAGVKR